MTGHLGPGTGEVYDAAQKVNDFWFALSEEQQFGKDPALDRAIAEHCGQMRPCTARQKRFSFRVSQMAQLKELSCWY